MLLCYCVSHTHFSGLPGNSLAWAGFFFFWIVTWISLFKLSLNLSLIKKKCHFDTMMQFQVLKSLRPILMMIFRCSRWVSCFFTFQIKPRSIIRGPQPFDAAMLPVSQGALRFHSRSGWHENDLAGEGRVRGRKVSTRLRCRCLVSPEETGEGSCHSLSPDHSTEP